MYIYDNMALSSSYNENTLEKICRENKNTFYGQFFPRKSCCQKVMWKNMVEQDRTQMTIY